MVDICLDMSMLIYKANSSYEKVELIREFLSRFSMLQMLLRVCAEQKVIDTKKVTVFALEMEKIGKQAAGSFSMPHLFRKDGRVAETRCCVFRKKMPRLSEKHVTSFF